MPKKGREAEPGFWPQPFTGSGAMAMAPVSVCHHVSTIGQRPSPTTCQSIRRVFGIDQIDNDSNGRARDHANTTPTHKYNTNDINTNVPRGTTSTPPG